MSVNVWTGCTAESVYLIILIYSITMTVFVCRLVITPLTEQSWWTWDFVRPWGRRIGTASSFMTWTLFPKMTVIPTSAMLTPNTPPLPWTNLATSQCSAALYLHFICLYLPVFYFNSYTYRLCTCIWFTIWSIYTCICRANKNLTLILCMLKLNIKIINK